MTNSKDGPEMLNAWKQQEALRKIEQRKALDLQARIQEELGAVNKWYTEAFSLWCRSRDHSPIDRLKIKMCYYERKADAYRKYLDNGAATV
jgi:hypothetical protein